MRVTPRLALAGAAALVAWLSCVVAVPARAEDAGVRTLLMPGKLVEAHAKEEKNCEACHASFAKEAQDQLCLKCHEETAADIASSSGFHGRLGRERIDCSGCHRDHEGRDADITGLDRERFDHALTDFPLEGPHRQASCGTCHEQGKAWRDAPHECEACHRDDDRHAGAMGKACGDCHTVSRWSEAKFDHAKTEFALQGKHEGVACAACHPDQRYKDTPAQCYACHAISDAHRGSRGEECGKCHAAQGWSRISFDHERDGHFALHGRHAELRCGSCHHGNTFDDTPGKACADCHRSDDVHAGRNGVQCGNCHNQSDWKAARFDHARDGGFTLRGAHAEASCESCHAGAISKGSTPTSCVGCHKEDDIHRGAQGERCEACHQESAWTEKIVFDHGLGDFPLLGMHATLPCESCHADREYSRTGSDCHACHAQDDPHAGGLGKDCASCHNPAGWNFWRFDHDSATNFPLTGAHRELECKACHVEAAGDHALPGDCYSCHAQDDRHSGQFGRQCDRCHSTESFGHVQISR